MKHTVGVPDLVWEWAQRKSGSRNPSSFLREVMYDSMIREVQEPQPLTPEEVELVELSGYEADWKELGMQVDTFDEQFTLARKDFVESMGGEETALAWMHEGIEKRGIRFPRAFVMSLYKQKSHG